MPNAVVDVLASGTVCLGSSFTCDGYAEGYPFRVQTHIHDDHMGDFDKSKGFQDFYTSPETFALLVADRNADLEYRNNIHQVKRGDEHSLDDGSKLSLIPSRHMLGSCQVKLDLPSSVRVGYSSDFSWPLDEVIEVDELVVDSTYGSPKSVRRYDQGIAESCFVEIICERLRQGSVHVYAHRGTIERALHLLGANIDVPIVASERLIREVAVYQKYGFAIADLLAFDSEAGKSALKERSYVRLYSKGDGFGNETAGESSVTCSAYMANANHPLMRYSDRAYRVALSNHADFHGTMAYVEATGAKKVVTDNTRNHGCELAIAINDRLPGVRAEPSSNNPPPNWG